MIGAIILAVFVALLANLAPSGRFVINAPVVTITPNVSGQVIALPIQPNVPLKAGAVLFQIDPSPFQYKVKQIEAQLAAAKQNVQQLKASYDQATANVDGLTSQLAFHTKRLSDISTGDIRTEQPRYSVSRTRKIRSTRSKLNCGGPGYAAERQAGIGFGD